MSVLAAWLERQQALHPKTIDLTLERVALVARRMGLDRPSCPVITVGGTNGKGSTVAFLESLLRAAGRRVGVFTSPHLVRYNERIRVDGVEASDADIVAAFEAIERARDGVSLTFFEFNTLAALAVFANAKVDTIVLEVGLGGRLDATNLVSADAAVLCSIGFDHMDWLGPTLEDIGREKAGIFRAGRPAILATEWMPESVYAAIERLGALRVQAEREYFVRTLGADAFELQLGAARYAPIARPTLPGGVQLSNASAALVAVASLGLLASIDVARIGDAIASTTIRGRFQIVKRECEWILDVAHNVPAAEVLAANLAARPCAGRTWAVCGILGDKDIAGVGAALGAAIDRWILCGLEGPRAVDTATLAARLPSGAVVSAHAASVAEACRMAAAHAAPSDRIVVFGSFHTVGPALEYLGL